MSAMERDTVNTRRMARSDIDAVLALDKEVSRGQSRINYRDMVAIDSEGALDLSFVAEAGGRVVGFILARLTYLYIPFAEVCIIQAIVVDPDYQRHRIGSRLVDELLSHCQDEGINTVRTIVSEQDAELRRFIERLGFHRSVILNYDKTFET